MMMETAKLKIEIPYGYCKCGCGGKTVIAKLDRASAGWVKGEPLSYINGHNKRIVRDYKPRFFKMNGEDVAIICAQNGRWALMDADIALKINGIAITVDGTGYPMWTVSGEKIHLHRFVVRDAAYVDHINGNKLDGRRSNLRGCTHSQNLMNRGKTRINTSGYKGVEATRFGRWAARIRYNGVRLNLGNYLVKEDAARAYDRAALIYHGEFAHLNFPDEKEDRLREIAAEKL